MPVRYSECPILQPKGSSLVFPTSPSLLLGPSVQSNDGCLAVRQAQSQILTFRESGVPPPRSGFRNKLMKNILFATHVYQVSESRTPRSTLAPECFQPYTFSPFRSLCSPIFGPCGGREIFCYRPPLHRSPSLGIFARFLASIRIRHSMSYLKSTVRSCRHCISKKLICPTGDVMHFNVLGKSVIILSSTEAATDLLDKRSANYSDRPAFPAFEL